MMIEKGRCVMMKKRRKTSKPTPARVARKTRIAWPASEQELRELVRDPAARAELKRQFLAGHAPTHVVVLVWRVAFGEAE